MDLRQRQSGRPGSIFSVEQDRDAVLALGRQPVANLAQVIGAERLVGMGDQCSRIVRSILPSRILLVQFPVGGN